MDALYFFIQKADSLEVECYASGFILINIVLERDSYDRVVRAIEILKDENGLVEVSCYIDWGGDGRGAASILDDELQALIEFVPAFKAGQDKISKISSSLFKLVNASITGINMVITDATIKFKFGWDNTGYSCSISRSQFLHCENVVPEVLKKEIQSIARLIFEKE